MSEQDRECGSKWVLKVFKKITLSRQLQSQWPHGYLQFYVENVERSRLGKLGVMRYFCNVFCGTLLKDGRFAFLMLREEEDLRSLIDGIMELKINQDCRPFANEDAKVIIWRVAKSMDWLYSPNIVH
jgi:hypothetical protein